jgi:hypothetical protein
VKKIALTVVALSTLALAACGDRATTNNTAANVSDATNAAISDLNNAASDMSNTAGNISDSAANLADATGNSVSNVSNAVANETH